MNLFLGPEECVKDFRYCEEYLLMTNDHMATLGFFGNDLQTPQEFFWDFLKKNEEYSYKVIQQQNGLIEIFLKLSDFKNIKLHSVLTQIQYNVCNQIQQTNAILIKNSCVKEGNTNVCNTAVPVKRKRALTHTRKTQNYVVGLFCLEKDKKWMTLKRTMSNYDAAKDAFLSKNTGAIELKRWSADNTFNISNAFFQICYINIDIRRNIITKRPLPQTALPQTASFVGNNNNNNNNKNTASESSSTSCDSSVSVAATTDGHGNENYEDISNDEEIFQLQPQQQQQQQERLFIYENIDDKFIVKTLDNYFLLCKPLKK